MKLELTLKLGKGKKVKLTDAEARDLRNMLNRVYGEPARNWWYTYPMVTKWQDGYSYTVTDSTADYNPDNVKITSTSDTLNLDFDLVSGVLEPHDENKS